MKAPAHRLPEELAALLRRMRLPYVRDAASDAEFYGLPASSYR